MCRSAGEATLYLLVHVAKSMLTFSYAFYTRPCLSPCRLKKPKRHVTADIDFEAGHAKTVHNPLHTMAEDAYPTMERTIEESFAAVPAEVYPNTGAHVTERDIDSLPWPKFEEFDIQPPKKH